MVDHSSLLEETRMLEHRMVYGYYPEVVTDPGGAKETLKELIESYLYKDVFDENDIGKPDKLEKLVQALAFQIGSMVSANELAVLVGIDAKTVERYIEILEKSYIIFLLPSMIMRAVHLSSIISGVRSRKRRWILSRLRTVSWMHSSSNGDRAGRSGFRLSSRSPIRQPVIHA